MWINFHQQERNNVPHSGNGDILVKMRMFELFNEILNFIFFAFVTTCNHTQNQNSHNLPNNVLCNGQTAITVT